MDWQEAKIDGNNIELPERWLHLHYYESLNILFRMENCLRIFTYIILKNKYRNDWQDIEITYAEGKKSIKNLVKARMNHGKEYGYLGYEISSPLMYLNGGELTRLITSKTYWPLFAPYFKASKNIIETKFNEIEVVRNSLAHFRPIKTDDIDLIKQNIKHVFLGIEECLTETINLYNIVPTNTKEDWYKKLSTLKTTHCSTSLRQSKSENWISLSINYSCPTITKDEFWPNHYSYKILNLMTPNICRNSEFQELTSFCTYITEKVGYAYMNENMTPNTTKNATIIFRKDILKENYEKIASQLEKLLNKIEEETQLIQEDHLARGDFIESSYISASYNNEDDEAEWKFYTSNLKCFFKEDDPPEYWGDTNLSSYDFIAGSRKYPWMPSDICREDSTPF